MRQAPYQRIAADIGDQIRRGHLGIGEAIPSTRQIMSEWGIAMATATKVIAVLKSEGLVEATPGRGTRVRSNGSAKHSAQQSGSDRSGIAAVPHREAVLRAAIRMADDDGLEMLTMRRLAGALDIPTMSLYRYAATKSELLLLMADRIFEDVHPPNIEVTAWRARLEAAAHLFRTVFAEHPWAAGLFSLTRPQTLANVMVLAEWNLQTLHAMGLDAQTMMLAHINLFALVTNMSRIEYAEQHARSDTGKDIDTWAGDQAARFNSKVSLSEYPAFRYISEHGFDYDLDLVFEYGLQRMLDGIGVDTTKR